MGYGIDPNGLAILSSRAFNRNVASHAKYGSISGPPRRGNQALRCYATVGTRVAIAVASLSGSIGFVRHAWKPLLSAFLHLAHRLLGGAGGSQSGSGGGFVSIPGLGAEANDVLESFAVPPFTQEKREATCS